MIFSIRDKGLRYASGGTKESRLEAFSKILLGSLPRQTATGCPIIHSHRRLAGYTWREAADSLRVSDDLSSAVAKALGGQDRDQATPFVPGLELSPGGLNLLNGDYAIPEGDPRQWDAHDAEQYRPECSGLSLRLSKAAKRRLGTTDDELIVSIDRMFAIFPSQICMIVTELNISSPGRRQLIPAAVEESIHMLCNKNRARDCGIASVKTDTEIGIQDLVRLVVPTERFEVFGQIRMFNYALVVLEDFASDFTGAEAHGFRCARHFTADYQIDRAEVVKDIYRPFESVVHAFALEGAATIINGSDTFLSEQFLTRVRQVYLWLIVLACHEQTYLLWLIQRDNLQVGTFTNKSHRLRQLIDDFLEFRLLHSIPMVSHIEMHNQTYNRLRRRLLIKELVQKVTKDVIEVERWLTQQIEYSRAEERGRRKARRQRYALLEVSVSAFLMFGLTFLAFDALLRKLSMLVSGAAEFRPPWNFVWPFVIGLAAASLRGWQLLHEIYEEPITDEMLYAASRGEGENVEAGIGVVSVSTLK
jgi:hypothetical protein